MARERNRRILYASGVGIAQRIVQVVTSLIMLPVVIHSLGIRDFGVWGAATSLAWLSGMLDLGIGSSLLTLLPMSAAAGRTGEAARLLTAALFGGCAMAAVVLVAGGLSVIGIMRPPDAAPMLVAVAGLAVNIPLSLSGSAWFALQRGYVAASWEFAQTLVVFGCLMAACALHAGVTAMVAAAYVPVALISAASLAHLFIAVPSLRPRGIVPGMASLRRVVGSGGLLFAITLGFTCCYTFDNLLALQWLGPAAAAQAAVALRICTLAAGMLAVLTQPLWPAFVEAVAVGDRAWALRALVRGTAATLALAVAGAVVVVACGGFLLRWWLGAAVDVAPPLLWVIAAWIVVLCTPRVAALLCNANSVLMPQFVVAAAAAALSFALKPLFAARLGVPGLVAAAPAAFLLVVWPAYAWLALRTKSAWR